MAKRKRSGVATSPVKQETHVPLPTNMRASLPRDVPKRRASSRAAPKPIDDTRLGDDIIDAPGALRASPDSDRNEDVALAAAASPGTPTKGKKKKGNLKVVEQPKTPITSKKSSKVDDAMAAADPEADEDEEANEEEVKEALARPPPVNSDYLPLPWKGRLGYACLNTYLRNSNPPVFSSRTCRIASILEHRHPLKDPSQPEHATKNRPDKDQPADIARGQAYVEGIGLANARDIIKMLRWNDRYNIKFFRLSSEMFPFASHEEYGYKLAPFASDVLAEVGKVVAELGHRVSTHPGQFTQLGSPRKQVIDASFRDLEYHDEMLSLLKLPPQQDRDAIMVLHMGGVFGSKVETLERFRENYAKLAPSIKNRLVLENDDVSWSVHDLLPVCKELNIPLVLDFHHHNIVFDQDKIREGTKDIMSLYDEITKTWKRKGITPKMHYSEPTPAAITPRQRRKHAPRVATLPPCPNTMDLMIEAKDKEQAVFELMRIFKLPGFDTFNDIIPYTRDDDNKALTQARNKAMAKRKRMTAKLGPDQSLEAPEYESELTGGVPEDDVGMGGPQGRVYWPPGMEEWLRPVKRVVKKVAEDAEGTSNTKSTKKRKTEATPAAAEELRNDETPSKGRLNGSTKLAKTSRSPLVQRRKKSTKAVPTPSTSESEDMRVDASLAAEDGELDLSAMDVTPVKLGSRRSARALRVSYVEAELSA